MSNTVHGGSAFKKTKRVYLRTGTANEGYAMCYNWDAVGVDAENNAYTTTYGRAIGTAITDWCDARRVMVEAPSKTNNLNFAGVVDECSDGVVGPNWIEIHEPGSVCKIYAVAAVTVGALTSQNEDRILTFQVGGPTADTGKFREAGYPGIGAVKCLAESTASGDLVMAELLTGDQQSGGCYSMATAVNLITTTISSYDIMVGGLTILSVAAMESDTLLQNADGTFEGQHMMIKMTTAQTSCIFIISGNIAWPNLSAETGANAGDFGGSGDQDSAHLTAANDFVALEWHGTDWWVVAANVALGSA